MGEIEGRRLALGGKRETRRMFSWRNRNKLRSLNPTPTSNLNLDAPTFVPGQNEGSVEANSQSQFVATGFEKGRLKNVFLSTVYELVKNKYSQWVEVRCLLDVGSQSSLCTRVCAEKLQLKMEKINTVTSCVNDASMVVKNCVKTSLANEAKNFEKFVPLADDKFNIPDRIDMLLVAEIFYKLLKPLKFCCDNSHLVLQNTVFGYVENSKDIAIRRLNSLRKRLSRDSRYLSLCAEFLKEYEELGHLEGYSTPGAANRVLAHRLLTTNSRRASRLLARIWT
ncbi:integrase catalytic domain-containing protein [Trichonephila clavipes]|nr:integrase catalytic domain-containing protein [Trichonephila clavipes]